MGSGLWVAPSWGRQGRVPQVGSGLLADPRMWPSRSLVPKLEPESRVNTGKGWLVLGLHLTLRSKLGLGLKGELGSEPRLGPGGGWNGAECVAEIRSPHFKPNAAKGIESKTSPWPLSPQAPLDVSWSPLSRRPVTCVWRLQFRGSLYSNTQSRKTRSLGDPGWGPPKRPESGWGLCGKGQEAVRWALPHPQLKWRRARKGNTGEVCARWGLDTWQPHSPPSLGCIYSLSPPLEPPPAPVPHPGLPLFYHLGEENRTRSHQRPVRHFSSPTLPFTSFVESSQNCPHPCTAGARGAHLCAVAQCHQVLAHERPRCGREELMAE